MSFLQSVLFESPFYLGLLCFLLFAVVLLTRRRWEGTAARYSLPATLAVIALLFTVQQMVTTQREQVIEALKRLVTAVEEKNITAFSSMFSPQYESEGMGREDVVASIGAILQAIEVADTRFTMREFTLDAGSAEMTLSARATVRIKGGIGEFHFGRWRISWRHEPDGWKVTALRPEIIDGRPINSLHSLIRFAP